VTSQHNAKGSPAAAAIAVAVTAALPFLPVPGAHAHVPTWQPVAIVAQEEAAAPVAEVVDAPAVVDAPVEEAAPTEVSAPAEDSITEEATIVAEAAPVEESAPVEVAAATEAEASALKDEVTEVLEVEIPAVEAEIAGIKDIDQEQSAEDVIDLVEEEATVADEELQRGVPPPSAVAKLLDTIQSQLGSIKSQFGLN